MKRKVVVFRGLGLLMGLLLMNSCLTPNQVRDQYIYKQLAWRKYKKWKVVWEDHFNSGTLDTLKWNKTFFPDEGTPLSETEELHTIKRGHLVLKGVLNKRDTLGKKPYLSGGVTSKNKFAFQYGRLEIRARIKRAAGAWPGVRLSSEEKRLGEEVFNGEISLLQHFNYNHFVYQSVLSEQALADNSAPGKPAFAKTPIHVSMFNTYAVEWYDDKLIFFINDKETLRYTRSPEAPVTEWPFDQPFHLNILQQVDDYWSHSIKEEQLPAELIIDWVKLYQ